MPAGTKPGYVIDRDGRGLTKRERQVLMLLIDGRQQIEIGPLLGVTKQRVTQIVAALEDKGVVVKNADGSVTVTVSSR